MRLDKEQGIAYIFNQTRISPFWWVSDSFLGRLFIAGSIGIELLNAHGRLNPLISHLTESTKQNIHIATPPHLSQQAEGITSLENAHKEISLLIEKGKKEGKIPKAAQLSLFAGLIHHDGTIEPIVTMHDSEIVPVASLNKVAIAVCLFHELESNNTPLTAEHVKYLKAMLIDSDNASTNKITRMIGKMQKPDALPHESAARVQEILRTHFNEYCSNIFIEIIPEDRAHKGQAYHTKTSVKDHAKLLAAIECECVPGASFLKKIMTHKNHNRLIDYATKLPFGTTGFNKTGSTSGTIGDGAVIQFSNSDKRIVIVSVFNQPITPATKARYKTFMKNTGHFLGEITDCIYGIMNSREEVKTPPSLQHQP